MPSEREISETSSSVLSEVLTRPLPSGALDELEHLKPQGGGQSVVYLSTPITTGERFLHWRKRLGAQLSDAESEYAIELKREVIDENLRRLRPLRQRLAKRFEGQTIIDPTSLEMESWEQPDYHRFWLEVLRRYVDAVVLADGWSFSTGCTLEFAYAFQRGLPCLDSSFQPLDSLRATELLGVAADQLQLAHLPAKAQLDTIELMSGVTPPARDSLLKDEALAWLATSHNVALFASFAPLDLSVRYVLGARPDQVQQWQASQAVDHVLANSRSGSVNVRTFRPHESKTSPFLYGLTSVEQVMQILEEHAAKGYYTIVNETIDVHDGGVSGVSLGGLLEFSPDGTPRVVEGDGVTSLAAPVGRRLLSAVYGNTLDIPSSPNFRYEFSVHPQRVGHRRSHVLVWEAETVAPVQLLPGITWPNNFSRMIGDKTFGLLLAYSVGAKVPFTRVISRRVAPFEFGLPTGTGEWWLRTAPSTQTPGHFTSAPAWQDPFQLLQKEDRDGLIAAVLSQEAVPAEYSGATAMTSDDGLVIEGVAGTGDAFMLGRVSPQDLPAPVLEGVSQCVRDLRESIGDVRIEWAYDGDSVWVLQMHRIRDALPPGVLSPGEPESWIDFDPQEGLEVLRARIKDIGESAIGVRVVGPVGITSHVGDLLRQAGVPGRIF